MSLLVAQVLIYKKLRSRRRFHSKRGHSSWNSPSPVRLTTYTWIIIFEKNIKLNTSFLTILIQPDIKFYILTDR